MFRDPGADDPGDTHRARALRVSIGTAVAIAAVTAGLLTAPAAGAVMVGVTAAVGVQAIRGRLEHAADRWVLGSRLAGYANLNRDQAAELAASRDRVVAGQDAERRRIQRNLHDGVQQEIVALLARAGLVRQQLLRGDPAAADGLADMQRDLATTLQDVREIAYAIHPPTLSDRGLLEAIEAQSSRMALPIAVRADPRLRGVRFGEQIEATAWYVVAEALSNVVKHAGASEVEVSLSHEAGSLGLVIRDNGCGFDLDRPRGLGLAGLSDRLGTVGGSLTINSGAGLGTSVGVHIPVGHDQKRGLEQVVGRERADA